MDNCLLIFLKYPEAGKVKTRLAREIGYEKAARLYRLFVEATLKRTQDRNGHYEQLLFYTPVERGNEIESWLTFLRNGTDKQVCPHPNNGGLSACHPQIGSDLGERMLNALKTAFLGGAKKAVIIGTDSPTVDKEIIYEAFCRLKDNKVVIGPTADGGYYLIGVSSPAGWHGQTTASLKLQRWQTCLSVLFTGIDWGSNRVFEQTLKRVREENTSYSFLPLHYDVDNLEDLKTLKQEIIQMDVIKCRNLLAIYKMLVDELKI